MRDLLHAAADHAADYLEGVDERPVHATADYAACLEALGGPLPEGPTDPGQVLDDLVDACDPGLDGDEPSRASSGSSSAGRCRPRSRPTG